MRFLFKLLFGAIVGVGLLALAAVWLAFQDAPLLAPGAAVSVADIEQARRILERNDPRKGKRGALRHLNLSQADLDLLCREASKRLRGASVRVVLQDAGATLQASSRFDRSPFGTWLNIDAQLREATGLPRFESLRVGRLPVPGWLADLALERAIVHLNTSAEGQLAADMVQSVRLNPTQLQVVYQWRDDLAARVRSALVPPADAQRLRAYSDRLAAVVARTPAAQGVSLARLMAPLFELARERSAGGAPSADAARENRAAIIALAFYANGRGLVALTPAARDWPVPAPRTVTLAGRDDFPKHFLISAALAAEAGGALADAIGVYKEVDDSRGGSGFSFNDIAADRAGTRFGELAVRSPAKLQAALAAGAVEADFMPDVRDLPEFMPEAEFKRRFGGIGAPAYAKMMAEIEARVAARPLYR